MKQTDNLPPLIKFLLVVFFNFFLPGVGNIAIVGRSAGNIFLTILAFFAWTGHNPGVIFGWNVLLAIKAWADLFPKVPSSEDKIRKAYSKKPEPIERAAADDENSTFASSHFKQRLKALEKKKASEQAKQDKRDKEDAAARRAQEIKHESDIGIDDYLDDTENPIPVNAKASQKKPALAENKAVSLPTEKELAQPLQENTSPVPLPISSLDALPVSVPNSYVPPAAYSFNSEFSNSPAVAIGVSTFSSSFANIGTADPLATIKASAGPEKKSEEKPFGHEFFSANSSSSSTTDVFASFGLTLDTKPGTKGECKSCGASLTNGICPNCK